MSSFRSVSEVTLILFEEAVEFFISRSIPSGNIVHLFATDANVASTDTNNSQTWKLSKVYTKATTRPDTVYVRVTCSTGSTPTPPFYTLAYTYYVTVVDARVSIPSRELVLINDTNPTRTMEYFYDFPKGVGLISVVPSTLSDPNPVSTFTAPDGTVTDNYGTAQVSVVPNGPGSYRLRVQQDFADEGTNTIDVAILFNRYNAFRKYTFTYNIINAGDLKINGRPSIPFLIDFLSYDNIYENNIACRYIHNAAIPGIRTVLNSDQSINTVMGNDTTILPANTFYNVTVSDSIDQLVESASNFPLIQVQKVNDFVQFVADNRSTNADYRLTIAREFTFDNGANFRTDLLMTKILGLSNDSTTSSADIISGLQTIRGQRGFVRVVPPIISLELESIANQQEGIIRQSQSVRLFNFLMLDETTGYKRFEHQNSFPERVFPTGSMNTRQLRFRWLYNRMAEVQNYDTNGIPVQFLEPYYVTMRIQFRVARPVRSGETVDQAFNVEDTFITLTGTESSPEIVLDKAVSGIQLVELMDARLPKQAEAVATSSGRRCILGYVSDFNLS